MVKKYVPRRGDVIWTDVDPAAGHEQKGKRPAIVLSPSKFNRHVLMAVVAPITSRIRNHGFEVPLNGKKISGAVLCHQVKTMDYMKKGVRFAEKTHASVIDDVLAKVTAILGN